MSYCHDTFKEDRLREGIKVNTAGDGIENGTQSSLGSIIHVSGARV